MINEKLLVNTISSITSRFSFPGIYPLARKLYSFYHTHRYKGVELIKPYLDKKYKLSIKLFSKDLIDHKILFTGVYEQETNLVLEKYIRKGDWIIEAGANSGSETLLLSRLTGKEGKVLAFEPVPHVAQKLKNNLELNKITNVLLFEEALGDQSCSISLNVLPMDHPNQGMSSKYDHHSGGTTIMVNQRTVDELVEVNKLARLDFLKMDVQGAEYDILKGSEKTIEQFSPIIFLEAFDAYGTLQKLYSFLNERRYSVHLIEPNGNLKKFNSNHFSSGNWLALPQGS